MRAAPAFLLFTSLTLARPSLAPSNYRENTNFGEDRRTFITMKSGKAPERLAARLQKSRLNTEHYMQIPI